MNIEKLGIKPLEGDYHEEIGFVFATEDIEELEQQRNEMLEALITLYNVQPLDWTIIRELKQAQRAMKSVTGRSWEEIKELLND